MAVSNLSLYIILGCVLAFAVGFIFVTVRAYNRRLDRIARGEARDTHSGVLEPRTAVDVVYRTVLIMITVISFFTVSAVNGKLSSLQNTVSYLQARQQSMSQELRELRQQLEEQSKLAYSSDWELLNVDLDRRMAEVSFTVTLRQYTEDTEAALSLSGRTVPLARQEGGRFGTSFTANLFEEYEQPLLLITEEGKTVTEDVDFPEYLFWDLLPMPMFECRFQSDMSLGKLKYEGSYKLETDRTEDAESVTVTYLTGGRELKTLDLTEETRNGTWIELEEGLKLEKDLTFRIEIVTKTGFRIVEQTVMIYDSSADLEDMEFTRIYDLDGELLWEDPYLKFK